MAVFTSAYCNYRWAKLFHRQDSLAFSQGHIDFFSHLQGVHKELVFDNMRVATAKFVGRTEKNQLEPYWNFQIITNLDFVFATSVKVIRKGMLKKALNISGENRFV